MKGERRTWCQRKVLLAVISLAGWRGALAPRSLPASRVCAHAWVVMQTLSMRRSTYRHDGKSASRPEGFSLLEMMMVITVILIVASISAPIYMTAVVRAREAVLADHLFTLRALIDRFTLDNGRAPLQLEEFVEKGYLGENPNRSLHRLERDLAGDKGRRAPLTQANRAGDCGRTQRLEPSFTLRHPVQHLVAQGPPSGPFAPLRAGSAAFQQKAQVSSQESEAGSADLKTRGSALPLFPLDKRLEGW